MLIIQIALGIFLGFILINYLPEIIALTGPLVLIALIITLFVTVAWGLFSLLGWEGIGYTFLIFFLLGLVAEAKDKTKAWLNKPENSSLKIFVGKSWTVFYTGIIWMFFSIIIGITISGIFVAIFGNEKPYIMLSIAAIIGIPLPGLAILKGYIKIRKSRNNP